MDHIAIDLGSRTSQICVRDAQGQIVEERACTTRHLGAYLRRRPVSRVIVETSSEAFGVARMAQAAGHQVAVVPAVLSRALGVGHRGTKTDVRDARALSEASTRVSLPSVHIPSEQSVHWRAMSTSRQALVRARTLLINRVRGYLRTQLRTPVRCTSKTLPKAVRRALESSEEGLPSHLESVLVSIARRRAVPSATGRATVRLSKGSDRDGRAEGLDSRVEPSRGREYGLPMDLLLRHKERE